MRITSLGHAGFCVESDRAIVIMDPWLSPTGAFDSAWFQLPRNHHMAAFVQEKLQDRRKDRFLYISHEHKDHFDLSFLNSLQSRDFTLIIPNFRRDELRKVLSDYKCKQLLCCDDEQQVQVGDGVITLYLNDHEINRDSAILVKADGFSFLNLNDCKIHDRLPAITKKHGPIDVFTAQFSGAIWHPTCYDYPKKQYESICRKKMISKFEAVARAIETINPRVYLTSAGPACYLDPLLIHINFQPVNIFPRAPKFFSYLSKRLKKPTSPQCFEPMPGDVLDVQTGAFVEQSTERVTDDNFAEYVHKYAALYQSFFKDRQTQYQPKDLDMIWERLREALVEKLQFLTLHDRVKVPLYFRLSDAQEKMIRIDFPNRKVEFTSSIIESNYYSITSPSCEVVRLLDKKLTWEDFALTFRIRLNREPDIFQAIIYGFLMMEPEDMNYYCAKVLNAETRQERMVVEANGCRYSANRFCPHEGADLTQGWVEQGKFLTCPRHRWQFDLTNNGQCTTSDCSIHAYPLEED